MFPILPQVLEALVEVLANSWTQLQFLPVKLPIGNDTLYTDCNGVFQTFVSHKNVNLSIPAV